MQDKWKGLQQTEFWDCESRILQTMRMLYPWLAVRLFLALASLLNLFKCFQSVVYAGCRFSITVKYSHLQTGPVLR